MKQAEKDRLLEQKIQEEETAAYSIKAETAAHKLRKAERRADFRKFVLPMVVILLLFFGAGIKYARYVDGRPDIPVATAGSIVTAQSFEEPAAAEDIVVKVSGQVGIEGYFSLSANTSLRELLEYAGVKSDGDIAAFDFSHKLVNGDEFYVKDKNNPVDTTPWLTNAIVAQQQESAAPTEAEFININTADLKTLMELPGIGEKKAQAIIDYRTKKGKYIYKEDILGVKGIGKQIFKDIQEQITV